VPVSDPELVDEDDVVAQQGVDDLADELSARPR
jgi:hypothetical protein